MTDQDKNDFKPSAKIVLDSISPSGERLTTLEVTMHRYMLPEFNTHRAFSRNSASSRAIPFAKMVEKARTANVYPVYWRKEQKGMQGGEIITDSDTIRELRAAWDSARTAAILSAERAAAMGVHKSIVNRLLEPYLPHTVVVTATDFEGFFKQRCNSQAQDDIRMAAEAMQAAYYASKPAPVSRGLWHLPYITDADYAEAYATSIEVTRRTNMFMKISAARCARVSYLTHDGKRDWEKDLDLYHRLVTADPGHWSPLEHVAMPRVRGFGKHRGNFTGWSQLRHLIEYSEG